ncbi:MAG: hypothetical protein JNM52_09455 [Betaproteobacteria bacterium]|nr:hypothetical protein [Betaproteobacteria bacterium]
MVLFFTFPAQAANNCDSPQWLSPSQHQQLTTARPVMTWAAVAGATGYEVAIESRVPEGEVLSKVNTQTTAPAFTPSAALTRERALVAASVVALCAEGARSLPAERVFFIDVRGSCPAPAGLQTMRQGNFVRLTWPDTALKVEARFFSGDAATPEEGEVSSTGALLLPLPTDQKRALGVRSLCREATSRWVWLRF